MRLTWQRQPLASAARPAACSWVSFMPSIITYSRLTRRPVRAAKRRPAPQHLAIGHLRLIGTSSSRSASVAACRLIARFTCGSSSIMRSIPGTTPEVLTVMWRAPIPSRSGSFRRRTASKTRSALFSGSPIPMKTML